MEVASVDIHPSDQPVLHEVLLRTRPTRLVLHVGHHTRVAVGDEVEAYEGLGELLDAIAGFEIEAFGLDVCAPLFEEATAECVGTLVGQRLVLRATLIGGFRMPSWRPCRIIFT